MAKEELPINWICTPLSYAKQGNQYSLFQQSLLLKVSEHIQQYIQEYFGSERRNSKEIPRPLFTEAQKNEGIGIIRVPYAELGVAANNFPQAKKQASECLKLQMYGPDVIENGKLQKKLYNVFTTANIVQDSSSISFTLNVDMLNYVFDMSQRYVTHPDNIAIEGKVEKMPLLYYLLRDKMRNWQFKSAQLTVTQIKEFLGMIKENDGKVTISYPKFSQFKTKVLVPALNDIQRLKDEGKIDVSFDMECMYKGKREVGDPAYIKFSIKDDKKKKKPEPTLFDQAEEVKPVEKKPQIIRGDKQTEWGRALSHYSGHIKSLISEIPYLGTLDGFPLLNPSKEQREQLEANGEEWDKFLNIVREICGFSKYAPAVKFKS